MAQIMHIVRVLLLGVGLLAAPGVFALSQPAIQGEARLSVEQLVREWARAWDSGDLNRYLSFYASDFVPAGGLSRVQWQQQRRERLSSGPRYVILRDLHVDVAGSTAVASFTQHYMDKHLIGTAEKRLLIVQEKSGWKIRAERVESEHQTRR